MGQRILVWLLHAEERGLAQDGVHATQAGLANATGLTRGYVSRTMAPLLENGWVRQERRRLAGFSRSLVGYRITPEGRAHVSDLVAVMRSAPIEVRRLGTDPLVMDLGSALERARPRPTLWEALQQLGRLGYLDVEAPTPTVSNRVSYVRRVSDAPSAGPFFGREKDLARFHAWLGTGRPCLVLEGPAGIGKSTLVAHALRIADPRRHILWLRLLEGSSPHSVLDRLAAGLAAAGRPGPLGRDLDPDALLSELSERVRGLPWLVVVDDVHKADPAQRPALGTLVRLALRESSFRVVLIGREVTLPSDLLAATDWHGLRSLDPREIHQLLAHHGVPEKELPALVAKAAGNPLFAELLARHPRSVEATGEVTHFLIRSLTSSLTGERLRAARLASTLRAPCGAARYARLKGVSESVLQDLVGESLLVAHDDGRLEMHDLVREIFYGTLSVREREQLHGEWAEAFRPEGDDWSGTDEFLHHLSRAGRRDEAVRWLLAHRAAFMDWTQSFFARAGPARPGDPGTARAAQ